MTNLLHSQQSSAAEQFMSPHVADTNRFSYDAVHRVLGNVFEHDLHAKRIDSLCNATIGVLHSASLAVSAIGHGLAAARGLATKHATKQIDRLLSNDGIKVDDILALWVPYVIGARTSIVVAMDWTDGACPRARPGGCRQPSYHHAVPGHRSWPCHPAGVMCLLSLSRWAWRWRAA